MMQRFVETEDRLRRGETTVQLPSEDMTSCSSSKAGLVGLGSTSFIGHMAFTTSQPQFATAFLIKDKIVK
jgi:hypothetical protein